MHTCDVLPYVQWNKYGLFISINQNFTGLVWIHYNIAYYDKHTNSFKNYIFDTKCVRVSYHGRCNEISNKICLLRLIIGLSTSTTSKFECLILFYNSELQQHKWVIMWSDVWHCWFSLSDTIQNTLNILHTWPQLLMTFCSHIIAWYRSLLDIEWFLYMTLDAFII